MSQCVSNLSPLRDTIDSEIAGKHNYDVLSCNHDSKKLYNILVISALESIPPVTSQPQRHTKISLRLVFFLGF